jgi:predicted  nucleic acid-binding Zn-ribbon protein
VAQKNNIRSIRFSDELAELIDRQVGRTFTEKFENLVTRCVWELPQKEQELERLKQEIRQKQQQLQEMKNQVYKLSGTINQLFTKAKALENAIDQETEKWES